ncbi:MAG: glutathione S-transferase [Alphaproteobacteria bacterium]|nr:glutathione S-transferase [Alphaproteobacteria bacterium]
MTDSTLPILYSFRRCPYAMRARLAIAISGQVCELREVKLANKPAELVAASSKATVPVLIDVDGRVIEESLDIMLWALERNDPEAWLVPSDGDIADMLGLIELIDGPFKRHLDRYKYGNNRFAEDDGGKGVDPIEHRGEALVVLGEFEQRLAKSKNLFSARGSLADFATVTFVRQFANVDRAWFDAQPMPGVQRWLGDFLASDLFARCMEKYEPWRSGEAGVKFGGR